MKELNKINVIGTSGTGKSTFCQQLAKKMDATYIEMDSLHWKANWVESTSAELFEKLKPRLEVNRWVLDGNYRKTIPIKWAEVDAVIWLDYSFTLTLFRAVKRAISRILSGRELWPGTGNVETFRRTLLSKDSIVLWTIQTYHRNRRKYLGMMNDERYSNIRFIVLRSPKQAQQFIQSLTQ
jgi:adenylate kinase family enzyme